MNTTASTGGGDIEVVLARLSSVSSSQVVPIIGDEAISKRVLGLSFSSKWSDLAKSSGDVVRNLSCGNNIETMIPIQELIYFNKPDLDEKQQQDRQNPDDLLPITRSRTGNTFTVAFHLLCAGIGLPLQTLPVAFVSLGWVWGSICMSLLFAWQLYTTWLLVHLHEPVPGTRYSRYAALSVVAFGPKMGKILAIFPSMYLSGSSCVLFVINGGEVMELLYSLVCGDDEICHANRLSGAELFLIFVCITIFLNSLFPSLNSLARFSLVGSLAAVVYTTMLWTVPVTNSRPQGVIHDISKASSSEAARFRDIVSAVGIIALTFRGHNVVLEIQGTLPADPKHPQSRRMWRGVMASYVVIALCIFPLAIGGYWAYGNIMPEKGIVHAIFNEYHNNSKKKSAIFAIYFIMLIHLISVFQIYSMPTIDNLERIYVSKKKKGCPNWLRILIRILFGGYCYFMSTAFPFLGSLTPFVGSLTLPLTLTYPCFMWNSIKKPKPMGFIWSLNFCLGFFSILLCAFLAIASLWNLIANGLDANFFNPH